MLRVPLLVSTELFGTLDYTQRPRIRRFLVHQAIEKSPSFVLLFFDVAVAVIAVRMSQAADPNAPVGNH
jgi:hypothetical protein